MPPCGAFHRIYDEVLMPDVPNQRTLPPQAVQAISQGRAIEAIKIVRQEWGVGLKEAKDAVDDFVSHGPHLAKAATTPTTRDMPPQALLALSQGKIIHAIKIVREEWGVGLKEAKDAVDDFLRTRPDLAGPVNAASAANRRGWMIGLIVTVVLILSVGYYLLQRP